MILQALYDYYQRKAADPDSGIAPEGFETNPSFALKKNGNFLLSSKLQCHYFS